MKTRDIIEYHFEEARRDLLRADTTKDPMKAIGSLILAIEHLMSAISDQADYIDQLEMLVGAEQVGDGTLRVKK